MVKKETYLSTALWYHVVSGTVRNCITLYQLHSTPYGFGLVWFLWFLWLLYLLTSRPVHPSLGRWDHPRCPARSASETGHVARRIFWNRKSNEMESEIQHDSICSRQDCNILQTIALYCMIYCIIYHIVHIHIYIYCNILLQLRNHLRSCTVSVTTEAQLTWVERSTKRAGFSAKAAATTNSEQNYRARNFVVKTDSEWSTYNEIITVVK